MKYLLILSLLAACASAHAEPKKQLWVYTSVYKEFIAPIEAAFEAEHPDIDVQVFQAGSEKIQAKVEAEQLAKRLQVDILMTSDPFWSTELEDRGLVLKPAKGPAIET